MDRLNLLPAALSAGHHEAEATALELRRPERTFASSQRLERVEARNGARRVEGEAQLRAARARTVAAVAAKRGGERLSSAALLLAHGLDPRAHA